MQNDNEGLQQRMSDEFWRMVSTSALTKACAEQPCLKVHPMTKTVKCPRERNGGFESPNYGHVYKRFQTRTRVFKKRERKLWNDK